MGQTRIAETAFDEGLEVIGTLSPTPAALVPSVTNNIIAATDGTQASATLLTSEYNVVTSVAGALDSVKLPNNPEPGYSVTVINQGSYEISIFPAVGDWIDSLAVNADYALYNGSVQTFLAISRDHWLALNTGLRLIERDVNAYDWWEGGNTLTGAVGTWTSLNADGLSSKLPKSAWGKPVHFQAYIFENNSNATSEAIALRNPDGPFSFTEFYIYEQNMAFSWSAAVSPGVCRCSHIDGDVEYNIGANYGDSYNLTVIGWWVV